MSSDEERAMIGKKTRSNFNEKKGNNERNEIKIIKKEKCVSKKREVDHEQEFVKMKTLEGKLRKGNEMASVEYDKL